MNSFECAKSSLYKNLFFCQAGLGAYYLYANICITEIKKTCSGGQIMKL